MNRYLKYLWLQFVFCGTSFLGDQTPLLKMRGWLARGAFKKVGKNFQLASGSKFPCSNGITIGDHVYIANYCWFQGSGEIIIEDEVMIGPFCVLATNNHTEEDGSYRFGPPSRLPIVIRKGAWLGAHVVVTAGTSIGEGARICAGAVVTRDVPGRNTIAGVPGKVLNEVK